MTEASVKLARLVKRYGTLRSNPTERVGVLAEGNPVAAKRKSKKKRTAKQKKATKKKLAANKRARRAKKAGKKTKRKAKRAKKKAGRRPKTRPMLTPGGVVQVPQGDTNVAAPKKRRKGKKKRKKTGKRKASRRKTTKRGGRRKKRRSKKRRGGGKRAKVTVTRGGKTRTVKLKGSPKVQYLIVQEKKTTRRKKRKGDRHKKKRKGKGRKRKGNPINLGHHASLQPNPGYADGLFSNAGPFTMEKMKDLGIVALGVGFGLMVSEIVDRLVATRKPADSDSTKANHPWYGRNAVAAIQRRPDAWRYGAQVAGVGVSLGLAYLARNMKGAGRIIPFLAGGAAVAFAAKGVMMLFNWELLPRVLKITDANEQTLANRIAVLEQVTTQDTVDTLFEKWAGVSSLANNQLETPSIQGPLSADTSQDILTLAGRQKTEGSPLGLGGRPGPLVETGRIGQCSSCNAMNGCYTTCPDLTKNGGCKPCQDGGGGDGGSNGGNGRRCRYIVQPGDDIFALARTAGIDMNTVNLMNDGTPDRYWIVGRRVTLPNGICNLVRTRQPETPPPPVITVRQPQTPPPTPITTATPALPQQPTPFRPDLLVDQIQPLTPASPAVLMVSGIDNDDDDEREETIL